MPPIILLDLDELLEVFGFSLLVLISIARKVIILGVKELSSLTLLGMYSRNPHHPGWSSKASRNDKLSTEEPSLLMLWLDVPAVGLAAYIIIEFEKWLRRKLGR